MYKKCIHETSAGYYGLIKCKKKGCIVHKCAWRRCSMFRPTLIYRLFGKWWKEGK